MAVSANIEFDVSAPASVVMEVLMDIESLPDWSGPHKEAEIIDEHDNGTPKTVRMVVTAAGISDEQTCTYEWTETTCEWRLIQSNQLSEQHGKYTVTATDKGSRVHFDLAVDLKIKLPGLIVKRAQKMAVDTARKGLTAEAEKRAAG
ncbi:SRPBCC family protein [Gordonia rubripertincta]|uniref:SRPBCC family protein n=2 Tax=Gordonia rubripertincta TaxID=36822 RepID=A0AAW4G489_GORRU|nr:SRPBCC family protein [Gordonia rubripertincta]ASR01507.1 Polyketide cyclase / dehydrase and lipid transport [Gordonia rubripertincta]MBM7278079.1 SRPBCC family protein [Gordonia rubripertincta]MDG6781063.1 SRPBCC family protein [Gordonia rubripertincta]NKY62452.1 SRPBCC family protein [Gordonia rubripertincta]QMU22419.1 SRPBCC family protein [Gordonia rubripertincta]